MIYIVILNWNSSNETIACLKSVMNLNDSEVNFKVIICDNNSQDNSSRNILKFLEDNYMYDYLSINEKEIYSTPNEYKILYIQNNSNYGYAGGNNVGIKFANNQIDLEYVWILNNDTEVDKNSLNELVHKMKSNPLYGVCGSRLVNISNRKNVQGIGGTINTRLCITKEVGNNYLIDDVIDELKYEKEVQYVIGASLLISKKCIEQIGYLCEDYFLYYEEIDYCNRAKNANFLIGISSKSIVFHHHGASTGKGKSDIADYYSVKNRIILTRKFYSENLFTVKLSILFVIFNRIRRLQFKRAVSYIGFLWI